MSGHSKWAKIKRTKGVLDQKRGKLFSKIGREIQAAAKIGGGDPNNNPRLRVVLAKAKEVNMPADTIRRAIAKGTGEEQAETLEEITYEGYGPHGVAFLVEALTDNRNRTASEVRAVFTKHGGNLGESGSVGFLFDKRGLLQVSRSVIGEDELLNLVLEAGAEDLKTDKETVYEIWTAPESFLSVREALEKKGLSLESAEITMVPKSVVPLGEKEAASVLRLYDALDDLEDVQNVYANFEIDEKVLERLQKNG